jgi:hypothetical protein
MVYCRHNLCGARRHWHGSAYLANHTVSLSRCGLLLQKLGEDAQVAADQQMVWRVHTKLHRRQGVTDENQDSRFNRAMDNDSFFNSFHFGPTLTNPTGFAHAVNHGGSGNRSQHTHFKAVNLQKKLTFTIWLFQL